MAEPVSQAMVGLGPSFGNVYTAAALSRLSVKEMVQAFERLSDYCAERLVAELRQDYYKSRR